MSCCTPHIVALLATLVITLCGAPEPVQARSRGRHARAHRGSRAPLSIPALQRRLRREYAKPLARLGTLGVYVKVLGGRVIFSRRGTRALHPASCVKLVTSSTALRILGKGYQFETALRGKLQGGVLTTPLYLWGQGDPSLTRDDLAQFATALKARGVTRIPSIVVDDTYFDRHHWPPGFRQPSSSGYMTPTGAVSLDGNTVEVVIEPTAPGQKPKVTLVPPSDYLELSRRIKTTTSASTRITVVGTKQGHHMKVVVIGRIRAGSSPQQRWVRVLHPARYAGESLKHYLTQQGIQVGEVKLGRAGSAPVLVRHRSKTLAELVQTMNRTSNNFYAEQLLKALGAKAVGLPGSTRKGVRAARGLLHRSGIRRGRYRMVNGSGLFGATRFSAKQLVRLLERLHTLPWLYEAIRNSLPIAGLTGTLSKRFGGTIAAGHVHAKTGTLNSVSCLAGYVDGPAGRKPLVFAILHNGFKRPHYQIRRVQDRIVELLARYQWRR